MQEKKITLPKFTEKEVLKIHGDLENYLLKLDSEDGLYKYSELPIEMTSFAIDTYANRFVALANQSTDYNELGAYIHLRKNPRALIFPTRFAVGKGEVTPPFARRHTHVSPVAFVHNHPTNGSFSQPPGHDIGCVINGYEDQGDRIQVPVWVLATQDDNYLLLRTQETQSEDAYKLYEISYRAKDNQSFMNFRRNGTETARMSSREDLFSLLQKAENKFFGGENGLQAFYGSLYGTYAVAQACKLGFYHSYKDGKYRQITASILDTIAELRYEQALQQVSLIR